MHGSRSKTPVNKSRQAAFAEGFNSGVKLLKNETMKYTVRLYWKGLNVEKCVTFWLFNVDRLKFEFHFNDLTQFLPSEQRPIN
jgi:hypothetical protein